MRRRLWLWSSVAGVVFALVVGRWLALHTADLLWARALGAGDAYAAIATLRLALESAAFLGAAVWCVGNLYLVYRQIGSVQVPRRVGNLEIVENIPRRFLLGGAVGIGLILAFALSHGAGDWWADRALVETTVEVGVPDPVLGKDVGYYLFRLPWLRAVHGYFVLVVGIVLVLLVLLYGAIGAVRWSERRLVFTDLARWHLGAVLAAFALVLTWGYRLEPAELVAGIHDVPYDGILLGVRIPAARLLGGLSLLTAAVSLFWMWLPRGVLPAIAWGGLAVASLVGHYLAPPFVAAARGTDRAAAPDLTAAQAELLPVAFALTADTVRLELAVPHSAFSARHRNELLEAPLWDHFAVTHVLNRVASAAPPDPRSAQRFVEASLAAYPGAGGRVTAVYLAARQPDTALAAALDRTAEWEARRGEPYAYATGVVAIHAGAVGPNGRPRFVRDLARPDSLVDEPVDVRVANPDIWFAPAMSGYAIASRERDITGIPAGGFWRRLALVWALQAPRLLTSSSVAAETVVLADRGVDARLARLAPFARFGAAYPAVVDRRLVWLSAGYVASETYPLSLPVAWRGQRVRYLRAGFMGVVDAQSGATSVYLLPDPDPLSRAWAELVPELVRPAAQLPAALRARLRYPEELFTAQLALVGRRRPGGLARQPEPFWWVGAAPGDPTVRLRLRAVMEVQVEPRVAAVVDGYTTEARSRLVIMEYPEPYTLPGTAELVRPFARGRPERADIAGTPRLVPFRDGALAIQTFYTDSGTVLDAAVGWRGAVGRGSSLAAALDDVRPLAPRDRPTTAAGALEAARDWFRRLDSARAVADWRTFGEAWEGLRDALRRTDSLR